MMNIRLIKGGFKSSKVLEVTVRLEAVEVPCDASCKGCFFENSWECEEGVVPECSCMGRHDGQDVIFIQK